MHEVVLWIFKSIKSILYFIKIVCVFCILMLVLYWIQNLTHATWEWLGFIKPFLDWLLNEANKIYSVTFNFFGAEFELKYFSALVILVLTALVTNLLTFVIEILEGIYKSAHFVCKKTKEKVFNNVMHANIEKEEKKITKYAVLIRTQIKKKFRHCEINVDVEEQNKLMNNRISEGLGASPMNYKGGYLYQFNDFDKIDIVLDIMFKIINSSVPIEPAIVIQAGDNLEQLEKLMSLENYGKVTMASDTAYRYKFNNGHRYSTSQIGLFQNGENVLEVHEFKEIL